MRYRSILRSRTRVFDFILAFLLHAKSQIVRAESRRDLYNIPWIMYNCLVLHSRRTDAQSATPPSNAYRDRLRSNINFSASTLHLSFSSILESAMPIQGQEFLHLTCTLHMNTPARRRVSHGSPGVAIADFTLLPQFCSFTSVGSLWL